MPDAADISFDTGHVDPANARSRSVRDRGPPSLDGRRQAERRLPLALLGRAARTVVRRADDAGDWEVESATVTYLRPPDLGPGTVCTWLLRRGRTAAHVRAVLVQQGADVVDAMFVVGAVPVATTARYDGTPPFHAPDPASCVRLARETSRAASTSGSWRCWTSGSTRRPIPSPTHRHPPAHPRELRGWTRFADGRAPDPLSLLFTIDAMPPPTLMIGSSGWVPTLQMSAYVRGVTGAGLVGHPHDGQPRRRRHGRRDLRPMGQRGHVVAQSTQLARLRFPDDRADRRRGGAVACRRANQRPLPTAHPPR